MLNHGLQAKIDCYKMLVEELQKERKNSAKTQCNNGKKDSNYKNTKIKPWSVPINNSSSQSMIWLTSCLHVKAAYQTVTGMLGNRSQAQKIRNCAQCLEDELEGVQQQYEKEKQQTSQLQEALRELTQICESWRNDIMQLKGELEAVEKQAALRRRNRERWLPMGSLL